MSSSSSPVGYINIRNVRSLIEIMCGGDRNRDWHSRKRAKKGWSRSSLVHAEDTAREVGPWSPGLDLEEVLGRKVSGSLLRRRLDEA